jgi:hypothetical protein
MEILAARPGAGPRVFWMLACGRTAAKNSPAAWAIRYGRDVGLSPMSMSIRILGTSASRPTVERGVSSLAIHREGETLMFDCGEGTQRQMMRWGVAFSLADIFFTHMHADHILGVIGLIRTMAMQGRHALGPPGRQPGVEAS